MKAASEKTPLPADEASDPRVSVIVVNWNTRQLLLECLRSIPAGALTHEHEVIVVDNGSSDGSVEAVREAHTGVELITNPRNLGYARANEQGFQAARGEYFLLLNSDTTVTERAIDRAVEYADAHEDAAVVGCRTTYPDGRAQPSCFRFPNLRGLTLASLGLPRMFPRSPFFNWDGYGGRDWSQPWEVDFVVGSFLLLRASAVQSIGGFDPRFFLYGEEADLCYRLRRQGWRTLYDPEALVLHARGGSAADEPTRAWAYEAKQRAILFFLSKHHGLARAWFGNLVMFLGMPPRLVAWAISDLCAWMRKRSTSPIASLRRARILRFHLAALLLPTVIRRSWERP